MIAFEAPLDARFGNKLTRWFSRSGELQKWAALATFLLASAVADARTVYVNQTNTTPGDGTSWVSSFKYLRDALSNTTTGDQIWVAEGIYYPDDDLLDPTLFGDRTLAFELKGQTIYGGFAGTETNFNQRDPALNPTILSGAIWAGLDPDITYSSLHVIVMSESSTLDGITVEGGNANGTEWWAYPVVAFYNEGAGCYVAAGKTLKLQGCKFRDNRSFSQGGAIKVEDAIGSVEATDCLFEQNQVPLYTNFTPEDAAGGAIHGTVKATNCRFITNTVETINSIKSGSCTAAGGAIAGKVNATGCEFIGNTVTARLASNGTNALATGGAIAGSVTALRCNFSANASIAPVASLPRVKAAAAGGAINGGPINAVNCTFSANTTTTGVIDPDDGSGEGGGGALLTKGGNSTLVNCVFVKNTSRVRGGAIHAGTAVSSGSVPADSLIISNCTFLDNGVATGFKGAALSCGGLVRIVNNVFWSTAATNGGFLQDNLVQVIIGGVLRNSDLNYPTPSTVAQNVVKGGLLGLTNGTGGDRNVGNAAATIVSGNPLFFNAADPDGADNIWRTADDGLRITAGSSAIGTVRNPDIPSYRIFLPNDTLDIDGDGNTSELIQADIANFARVQNVLIPLPPALPVTAPYVDMGAYEYGDLLHGPEISVEYSVGIAVLDGVSTIDFSTFPRVATTFVIRNTGTSDLNKLVITGTGVDITSFNFNQPAANLVAPGGSTTFAVTFVPTAAGPRTARLQIASNDSNEDPFDIILFGDAPVPDIAVEYPAGTDLIDDVSLINYGGVGSNSSASRTFTIRNSGLADLSLQGISSSGANSGNFTVSAPGLTVLAPGATTTFNVVFRPSGTGSRNASITIQSSDPDAESAFLFNVTGSGFNFPEIVVSEPFGREIANGAKSDFGSVGVSLLHSKTFVVKNTGTAILKNIAVTLSGSSKFTKTNIGVTSLAPGAQAKFSVTFKPTATGKKTATLVIKSNDADESSISIALSGTGVSRSSARAASAPLAESPVGSTLKRGVVTMTRDSDGLKHLVLTVDKSLTRRRTVEVSSNLTEWFSGPDFTTTLLDNNSVLRVRDKTPIKQGEKRYIRLK